jgi:hypothetical protein
MAFFWEWASTYPSNLLPLREDARAGESASAMLLPVMMPYSHPQCKATLIMQGNRHRSWGSSPASKQQELDPACEFLKVNLGMRNLWSESDSLEWDAKKGAGGCHCCGRRIHGKREQRLIWSFSGYSQGIFWDCWALLATSFWLLPRMSLKKGSQSPCLSLVSAGGSINKWPSSPSQDISTSFKVCPGKGGIALNIPGTQCQVSCPSDTNMSHLGTEVYTLAVQSARGGLC